MHSWNCSQHSGKDDQIFKKRHIYGKKTQTIPAEKLNFNSNPFGFFLLHGLHIQFMRQHCMCSDAYSLLTVGLTSDCQLNSQQGL